jgi:hypothetical protein
MVPLRQFSLHTKHVNKRTKFRFRNIYVEYYFLPRPYILFTHVEMKRIVLLSDLSVEELGKWIVFVNRGTTVYSTYTYVQHGESMCE